MWMNILAVQVHRVVCDLKISCGPPARPAEVYPFFTRREPICICKGCCDKGLRLFLQMCHDKQVSEDMMKPIAPKSLAKNKTVCVGFDKVAIIIKSSFNKRQLGQSYTVVCWCRLTH